MDQVDDLDETLANGCNGTLLTIVARGTAIVTELHRLYELVPKPFQIGGSYILNRDKKIILDDIISDFSYFRDADAFENRIESDEFLKRVDEDFCDQYIDLLTRFYLTFDSIQRYSIDLNRFINDLEDEYYVGHSLESMLDDVESRQLLCEAFFNLGHMLLTVDQKFDGSLRERLIVAYYRYANNRNSTEINMDETCNLMRSTGFHCSQQMVYRRAKLATSNNQPKGVGDDYRPANYPESLFARVQVSQSLVELLIAKLQSNDIYNQASVVYPQPEHRSNALAQQASILYVLLYFCPDILANQRSVMREISDKFFSDNWVLNVCMGELVDLVEVWAPYRAAREAIGQTIDAESAQSLASQFGARFHKVAKQVRVFLDGIMLDSSTFLHERTKIMNTIREANVVLKWLLLHSHPIKPSGSRARSGKTLQSIVASQQPDSLSLCLLLQDLAKLERESSRIYAELASAKAQKVLEHKALALELLDELIAIYANEKSARWVKVGANSNLAQSLSKLKSSLAEGLQFDERPHMESGLETSSTKSSNEQQRQVKRLQHEQEHRKQVIRLVNKLEQARDTYSDGRSLQVVQFFDELKGQLLIILRYLSLGEHVATVIESAADFGYAWRLMDSRFTQHLQLMIRDDPLKIASLGALFAKLAGSFDTQLMRLQQVGARADLLSVTQYYSSKLVAYLKRVLHIIPATILQLVDQLIAIRTSETSEASRQARVSLDQLKEFRLRNQRAKLLELTYRISHYAEGMLLMQSASIGLVRLDSRQLLEDGIRRELVQKMSDSIQASLRFERAPQQVSGEQQASGWSVLASSAGGDGLNGPLLGRARELERRLAQLAAQIRGYKRSFEYIQDYLFIYGLRMWQEELARIVKFNVEQAQVALLEAELGAAGGSSSGDSAPSLASSAAVAASSRYQSSRAPIPVEHGKEALEASFVARLLHELLQITSPSETIYDEQTGAWFDQRAQHQQALDLRPFELLGAALGAPALAGLDQVCSSLLVLELGRLQAAMLQLLSGAGAASERAWSRPSGQQVGAALGQVWRARNLLGSHERRAFARHSAGLGALIGAARSQRLLNQLARLGQLQAIRLSLSQALSAKCRHEARHLFASLEALDSALVALALERARCKRPSQQNGRHGAASSASSEAQQQQQRRRQQHGAGKASQPKLGGQPLEDCELALELAQHFHCAGLQNPLEQIYTLKLQQQVGEQSQLLVCLLFALLLGQSAKFAYARPINGLVPLRARASSSPRLQLDALPLLYGVVTLVRHYEPMLAPESAASRCAALDDLLQLLAHQAECVEPDEQAANLRELQLELARLSGSSGPREASGERAA